MSMDAWSTIAKPDETQSSAAGFHSTKGYLVPAGVFCKSGCANWCRTDVGGIQVSPRNDFSSNHWVTGSHALQKPRILGVGARSVGMETG